MEEKSISAETLLLWTWSGSSSIAIASRVDRRVADVVVDGIIYILCIIIVINSG